MFYAPLVAPEPEMKKDGLQLAAYNGGLVWKFQIFPRSRLPNFHSTATSSVG
jgi:hypothetical protein